LSAEFTFLSLSHKLGSEERKEYAVNAVAFPLILFLARAVLPFGLLILIGEWLRRREANYWLRK
jgi:hypothetical protein